MNNQEIVRRVEQRKRWLDGIALTVGLGTLFSVSMVLLLIKLGV